LENIYNYKTAYFSADFKDADSKKSIVTGYFSSFGNKDSDGDIIIKGAFNRTIEERGPQSKNPRIKHLLNHRSDQPLGKITLLMEDDKGLYYESKIGDHFLGKEFIAMVESDLITEHSIGFRIIDKEETREAILLKEIQLWEGSSLTFFGANASTPLTGVKSDESNRDLFIDTLRTKHAAVEKFCRHTDISDETIESCLLYSKQLLQTIIDLSNETTKPGETTLPDNKGKVKKWNIKPIISLLNCPQNGYSKYRSRITTDI
jgi:HK97 family phage prohead protease